MEVVLSLRQVKAFALALASHAKQCACTNRSQIASWFYVTE